MLLYDLNSLIFHIITTQQKSSTGHFVDTNLFFVFPLTIVCAFSKLQYTRNMNLALFKTIQFVQNGNVAPDANSMWEKKSWEVDFYDTGSYNFFFMNHEEM